MSKKIAYQSPEFYYSYEFPIGMIHIAEDPDGICDISFKNEFEEIATKKETALIKKTAAQLKEYFAGKRRSFTIKISTHGTAFQEEVWRQLQQIPYSETRSYGEIAALCNNPKASRAVGMANNKNRISILIPCHRVIGKDRKLVGYAGGLEIKKYLLTLEENVTSRPRSKYE